VRWSAAAAFAAAAAAAFLPLAQAIRWILVARSLGAIDLSFSTLLSDLELEVKLWLYKPISRNGVSGAGEK
jgi:hypothetical protein